MTNKFEITLNNIIKCFENASLKQLDIGFLSGKSGIVLFYFYYSKLLNNNIYAEKGWNIITEIINTINEGYSYHTFSSGIVGFCWMMKHFVQNGFITEKDIAFLDDLDEYHYKKMMQDIKSENYDFLHGALGNGFYFLNHLNNPKSKEYLIQLIDELDKISIKDKDGTIKWESIVFDMEEKPQKVFNLCLSHGIASIIVFLSKLYSKNIHTEKVLMLLTGAVNFILNNKLDITIYESNFPSWVCENEKPQKSRLAWCYGDLGIAIALYQASQATSNNAWKNIALEILHHSTLRKDLKKEGVIDAGICHGTAGIAHIYNRMYYNSKIIEFKEAKNYWIEETIKMAKFEDGLAGYKAWQTEKYGGWKNEYGILEGIAGIGLALILAVSDIEPKWDECLLLS